MCERASQLVRGRLSGKALVLGAPVWRHMFGALLFGGGHLSRGGVCSDIFFTAVCKQSRETKNNLWYNGAFETFNVSLSAISVKSMSVFDAT